MSRELRVRNIKISQSEPVRELQRVLILESGEPLVNFLERYPRLRLDRPRYDYRRETLLRAGVAERIARADAGLTDGQRLAIIEGWRAQHIQRRMYLAIWNEFAARNPHWSETQLKRVVNRFSAPLDIRVPPPHTTGGAIDCLLADADGVLLDFHSPYDPFDPRSFPFAAPKLSDAARQNRLLLKTALESVGLSNYPSEYWHWSFGDSGHAYRMGLPYAIYGATQPENYAPPAEELTDAPLISLRVSS